MEKERLEFVFDWKRAVMSMAALVLFCRGITGLEKDFVWENSGLEEIFLMDILLLAGLHYKVRLSEKWSGYYRILLLLLAPAYCFWEIEYLRGNSVFTMKFLFAALNYLVILTVFLILYMVTNRFAPAFIAGIGLFTFYGLLYSFIREFRGNGLRAADIYAWRTAANVSGSYALVFTEDMCRVILYAAAVAALGCYVECRNRRRDRLVITAVCMGFVTAVYSIFWNTEFMEENGVKPYLWELDASAKDHGALLDFAAGIPDLKMKKPEGYSAQTADRIQKEKSKNPGTGLAVTAAEEHKNPHVIVIMNEAFSDFRTLGELETDREFLNLWDTRQENTVKGLVSVPVFGGWTANSEFEFLTGFSNAFFPSGIIPFQNYVKEGMPNLNGFLKEQEYSSIFMHPMQDSGWNRKSVYKMLDFDQTFYVDDFKNAETLRGYITDRGNYKKLVEEYEKSKKEGPVFLFNVTMQNHGGYMGGSFPEMIHITKPEGDYPKAEEYLTLIQETDNSLAELLDYFAQEEEPVIVCMFGDHYPKVEEELYEALLSGKEAQEAEKTALQYQVPFMIYANYDIEEKMYENISLNYLSTLVCSTAGLPLSEYQNYLCALYEEYPVINVYGVKDKAGQWYTWDEAAQFPAVREYEYIQYRNLFENKK